MNIFVRTNFNNKVGFGHIKRVLNLLNNIKRKKSIKIFVDQLKEKNIIRSKFQINNIYNKKEKYYNQKNDAQLFLKKINSTKNSIVIIDDYRIGKTWEKIVSKGVKKIIVIDDFYNRPHYCDIYINSKPGVEKKIDQINKKNKKNCKFLLGPKFCTINKINNPQNKNKINSLTFYNGASGNVLIYKKIIDQILNLEIKNIKINIIVGPLVKNSSKIDKIFAKNRKVKIHKNLSNINNILQNTSLLISSAGLVIFESAYLNVPSIFFKMSKNQELLPQDLSSIGHNFLLKKKDLSQTKKICLLINLLLKNNKRIRQNFNHCKLKIDGLGSKRILKIITTKNELKNENIFRKKKYLNDDISFSKINDNFINDYLIFRNLKINLNNSSNKNKIDSIDHYIWWYKNLNKSIILVKKKSKPLIILLQKKLSLKKKSLIFPSMISCSNKISPFDTLKALKFQNEYIDNLKLKNKITIISVTKNNFFSNQQTKYFKFEQIKTNNKLFKLAKNYILTKNCNVYIRK